MSHKAKKSAPVTLAISALKRNLKIIIDFCFLNRVKVLTCSMQVKENTTNSAPRNLRKGNEMSKELAQFTTEIDNLVTLFKQCDTESGDELVSLDGWFTVGGGDATNYDPSEKIDPEVSESIRNLK